MSISILDITLLSPWFSEAEEGGAANAGCASLTLAELNSVELDLDGCQVTDTRFPVSTRDIDQFEYGSLVVVTATYRDEDGVLADPDAVRIDVRTPSGDLLEYTGASAEVSHPSTGVYKLAIDADEEGTWWVRVWATGEGQAAKQKQFQVSKLRTAA